MRNRALITLLLLLLCPNILLANTFYDRKEAYLDLIIEASETRELKGYDAWHAAIAKAYRGEPVNYTLVDDLILALRDQSISTIDFRMQPAVRLLYHSNGANPSWESELIDAMLEIGMWVDSASETEKLHRNFFSENHTLMYASAAYLLRQKYPHLAWKIDQNLDRRLKYVLQLKADLGFYEYFSTTYYVFSLQALTNLADFAEDPEIRSLAEKATKRMLEDSIKIYTDNGEFYPAAGRNYESRYTSSASGGRSDFWLITGKGKLSIGGRGIFLASSDIDYTDVANTYRSEVYSVVYQGHSITESVEALKEAGFSRAERGILQWNHGAYYNKQTAADTIHAINTYNLHKNADLNIFGHLASLSNSLPAIWNDQLHTRLATLISPITQGSNISESKVTIYKNKGVALVSEESQYAGSVGWQRQQWVATCGDVAVWTQTGVIPEDWEGKHYFTDSHLPTVKQDENVALVLYQPVSHVRWLASILERLADSVLKKAGAETTVAELMEQDHSIGELLDTRITLHWPTKRFSEHSLVNDWLVARNGDNYCAVRREGSDYWHDGVDEEFPYSTSHRGRQAWAVVVGNKDTHTSFDRFKEIISEAVVQESHRWSWQDGWEYSARVMVDGKDIAHSGHTKNISLGSLKSVIRSLSMN